MNMLKIAVPALLCLFFQNGCAQKQNFLPAQSDHTVEVAFTDNDPGLCHVYFIADDTLAYDFKTNGNYSITPGEYMVILQCQRANAFFKKEPYGAGNITKFTSPCSKNGINYDAIRNALKTL